MSEADRWRALRELDKRVAEVKGYTDVRIYHTPNPLDGSPMDWSDAISPESGCRVKLPRYSTHWAQAGPLLDEMAREEYVGLSGYGAACDLPVDQAILWGVFTKGAPLSEIAPTGPEAICHAYIAWKEGGR